MHNNAFTAYLHTDKHSFIKTNINRKIYTYKIFHEKET